VYSDNCDLRPTSQFSLLNLIPSCLRLVHMCFSHVIRRSRCIPKYFTSSHCFSWRLFSETGGHVFLRVVKVTWTDLPSLTLILHFFIQDCILLRVVCRRFEATVGSWWGDRIAVSSAYVVVVTYGCVLSENWFFGRINEVEHEIPEY
jgi:hypothetical protein